MGHEVDTETCLHWREVDQQIADRKFDGGEFSDSRMREPKTPMCGRCPVCVAYADELEALPPEMIHRYTRAQAIEDGVLVSMQDGGEMEKVCKEAGIKYPLAMTTEAFHAAVHLTPAAKRAGNDLIGRLWDVLTMMKFAIQRAPEHSAIIRFEVMVVRDRTRPTLTRLKCLCGPGDDAEPVLTIMLPEQD